MTRDPDAKQSPGLVSPHDATPAAGFKLRRYRLSDEDAAIALWLRTWQAAYPQLDFAARLDWWRARWRDEIAPHAEIAIAQIERFGETKVVGLVTIDPRTGYLDQLVVAPECWGSGVGAALLEEAKRVCPLGFDLDVNTDNSRAIHFYQKHGFSVTGSGSNPISGQAIYRMNWRP